MSAFYDWFHDLVHPTGGHSPSMPSINIEGGPYLKNWPKVTCADGFSVSIQAGPSHYCCPRNGYGPWCAFELGFPSRRDDALMPYIDGDEDTDPTATVYGYVPIHIVEDMLARHGGVKQWPSR